MIKCYKVVRHVLDKGKFSALVSGQVQIEYVPGQISYANKDLLSLGYGIFVFQYLHQAREFVDFYSGTSILEIWECKTEKFMESYPILLDLNFLYFGIYIENFKYYPKPGTRMVESLKLIKEIV